MFALPLVRRDQLGRNRSRQLGTIGLRTLLRRFQAATEALESFEILPRESLAAVLAYLEAYEPDLIACSQALGVTPPALVAAHQMLESR